MSGIAGYGAGQWTAAFGEDPEPEPERIPGQPPDGITPDQWQAAFGQLPTYNPATLHAAARTETACRAASIAWARGGDLDTFLAAQSRAVEAHGAAAADGWTSDQIHTAH